MRAPTDARLDEVTAAVDRVKAVVSDPRKTETSELLAMFVGFIASGVLGLPSLVPDALAIIGAEIDRRIPVP